MFRFGCKTIKVQLKIIKKIWVIFADLVLLCKIPNLLLLNYLACSPLTYSIWYCISKGLSKLIRLLRALLFSTSFVFPKLHGSIRRWLAVEILEFSSHFMWKELFLVNSPHFLMLWLTKNRILHPLNLVIGILETR